MKLKTVKTEDLKPHKDNPNRHPQEQLQELQNSLDQFDQVKNIVAWQGQVIAGCGLLEAAKAQGREEIEIQDVSDWPEKKALSYMIADNRLADLAIMDDDLLAGLLKDFDEPLDIPGIDEAFLDELGLDDDLSGLDGDKDADEVPEVVVPVVKSGELWMLGEHRVLCSDSTVKENIDRLMDGEKADMVFTDPPFDFDDIIWFDIAEKNLSGHFFLYGSEKVIIPFLSNENFCRLFAVDFRNAILISNKVPFTRVDFIAEFKNVKSKFVNTKDGFSTLIEMPKVKSYQKQNIGHPHQKKVELIELFLNHYTVKNEKVLDCFLGSGTVLIASEQTNRICYGIELSSAYCDIILERWAQVTGKDPVREDGAKFSELKVVSN